ncbi:hypothetical protein L21SP5_00468 [Salinivirga cyanobacteriivorans]|uniref:Outer membrane protein beta-barrel domain-containing protein n=2 Tax=Salinivirgaceae TaxID=1970190 RepID=A0A0S2HVS8_9BACT|nr:hypothetical protein L21SP5_00468 [Salinivirga cyanobacteriivorans]
MPEKKYHMRKLIILMIVSAFAISANAQSSLPRGSKVPREGNIYMNFGFGVSSWGVPFYAGAEVMVHDEVSVGGAFSYRSQSETFGGDTWQHRAFTIAARGNYHFNNLLKIRAPFLFYAGASLGFISVNTVLKSDNDGINYDGARGSGLYFGIQTGGSYFFNDHWAANAELGIGNVMGLKLGATYLF